MSQTTLQTELGVFKQDRAGIYHYHDNRHSFTVHKFAEDAVKHNPGAAFFWFNGTPAPIYPGDSQETLVRRWGNWRDAYQKYDGKSLLKVLEQMKNSEEDQSDNSEHGTFIVNL